MLKKDEVEVEGVVLENLPNATFKVQLDNSKQCFGTLSGKMRMHHIRILPGDKVRMVITPYDEARGRIVYRIK